MNITNLSRRRFISASAGLAATILVASPLKSLASQAQYHSLSFYHTHTGETLKLNFNLKASCNVAKKSLHMKGRAIDIRLSDIPTKKLRDIACAMQDGGVGYYAKSDFLHLDTGRFRTW